METKTHAKHVWEDLQTIKALNPLIHNVTNYVVMEHTANALLAIGASPVMAHAVEEVSEMARLSSALVLNIGTLSPPWVDAMKLALKTAQEKNIPVVLDPVGVGATSYRTKVAKELLRQGGITAIRGNASEIAALIDTLVQTKGVDSSLAVEACLNQAKLLAKREGCVVWMSGKTDIISNGEETFFTSYGHPLMGKITGMGCAATTLLAAFLAVNKDPLQGAHHAALVMGIAGEIAARNTSGPGSFKCAFIDALYRFSLDDLEERLT